MDDVRDIQIDFIIKDARLKQQMYSNHECTADEVLSRTVNEKLILLANRIAEQKAQLDAVQWQPIEIAPKGGGAELVTDPDYVKPPDILLYFPSENVMEVGSWDWYYAEGGDGHQGCSAWCCGEYEPAAMSFDEPTHWMPLPEPPQALEKD